MAYPSGYAHYMEVTIDYPAAGLTDFPALFPIDSAHTNGDATTLDVVFKNCLATGADVHFYETATQTEIPSEIEAWSGGAGSNVTASIWVKIPSIAASGTKTVVRVYYEKAGDTAYSPASGVWDANFKGVWHCSDASTPLADSTANGNTAAEVNTPAYGLTGKIGSAVDIDSNTDAFTAPNVIDGASEITFSAWAYADSTPSSTSHLMSYSSNDYWAFSLTQTAFYTRDTSTGNNGTRNNDVAYTMGTGAWHHVAARYSVSDGRKSVYKDGIEVAYSTTSVDALNSSNTYRLFGNHYAGGANNWLDGRLDEMHLSVGIARSAAWLAFEYANVTQADNELTWGTEQSGGVAGPSLSQLMRHRKYWDGSKFVIPPPGPLTLS